MNRSDLRTVDVTWLDNKSKILYSGFFHQWGIDWEYEEGNYLQKTYGIIEDRDGVVHKINPEQIKFTDN